MPINLDSALGNLPQALSLRARRTELLASNMANVDTPNYKSRDIDFNTAMKQAQAPHQASLKVTHAGHLQPGNTMAGGVQVMYRIPNQPSLDGNTVDGQLEQAAFSSNAVQHQATLTFLSGRFRGLLSAIKGE